MKRKFLSEVKGFEEFEGYSITEDGKVYSHYKRHDKEWLILPTPHRELKPTQDHKGYLRVRLSAKGNKKSASVHRLVALAFIPNPDNLPQVNHIDCNKQNNIISNLEWVTNEQNHKHKMENGLNVVKSGEEHYTKKIPKDKHHCCKAIYQLDMDGNIIQEFASVKTAGETLGIDRTCISKALTGKIKSSGGYKWKYKN